MGVRFIHTADWQIGKNFGNIPDEPRVVLARQRIETVTHIARLATENAADFVLVAGDVFETAAVADETIRRTLVALEAYSGPWVFLPGNHDAALAESPWTRMRRMRLPDNVVLATEPEAMVLADGQVTLFPAPLRRRHEAADLTDWFDSGPSEKGAIRIGLAHGSIADFLPDKAEAANPIAHDRAVKANLDYLALGDWHGTLRVGPRTWYAGTPEPDRFKANDPGNVLLVTIDAPGAEPLVEKLLTGHFHWHEVTAAVHGPDDIAGLREMVSRHERALGAAVIRLCLEGTVDFATRQNLEDALGDLRARVHYLQIDDADLLAAPSADDLDRIDTLGFVRSAIETLRGKADDPANPEHDDARLALQILYLEHTRAR